MSGGPPAELLAAYGLTAEETGPAGGTAGRTWRVVSGGARWFVRRRGPRTSAPARVAFDQGLRRHLAAAGFCATAPVANRAGQTWTALEDGVYEVYPWVDGEPLTPVLATAGRGHVARALAAFHRLAADYDGVCEALVPQLTHYPDPVAPSPRFDDPAAFAAAVDQAAALYATPADQAGLARAREWIGWLDEQYSPAHYAALPRGVIHGDFNGCNLLFHTDGRVAGVFDYDWAWRETRIRDVGEALLFFGALRDEPPDGGSIWSLTACPRFELEPMVELLRAYHEAAPLSAEELALVPLAMCGRWVACRTEGLMKVPQERRIEFLLADFDTPFEWTKALAKSLHERVGKSSD